MPPFDEKGCALLRKSCLPFFRKVGSFLGKKGRNLLSENTLFVSLPRMTEYGHISSAYGHISSAQPLAQTTDGGRRSPMTEAAGVSVCENLCRNTSEYLRMCESCITHTHTEASRVR